ncbi:50S ribosomal protein L11 methyltransferase [Tenacibaculum sp. SG-28]|uniref:50S ribosomal protein L11 methyltransferase n=1 Tax=Tenacibaculum sp. SG-28 TaxID=754426 RepID=UPI000CF4D331|nr:50S ribosomal protein L11 methyltransferase [Tenacibaculum sp. SG-28]PQJ20644.1 ribosomal protein L11 methyltransferase [Tenacibaculum sp. SG-28]
MDNIYVAYEFVVVPRDPATEILVAELGALGFESFVENETGVTAYIQKKDWNADILQEVFILNSPDFQINFDFSEIAQTNWNAEWEKNFHPIQVDEKVSVRAPFHENPNLDFDIVIEPKMSFGTGHHETTHMMLQHLLELHINNKRVLDMGCGTGILAIFAEMKGAAVVDAIDIDPWCYENTIENCSRNKCKAISVFQGDASLLKDKEYDLIIANINRNILIKDMEVYIKSLSQDGILLLSGFYKEDIPILEDNVVPHGMVLQKTLERNNWVALQYQKL